MAKSKIRFVPKPPTEKSRKKKFGNVTVTYTKGKKEFGVFMYNCECRRGEQVEATGYHSDGPELSWEQIERIPRFVELVCASIREDYPLGQTDRKNRTGISERR